MKKKNPIIFFIYLFLFFSFKLYCQHNLQFEGTIDDRNTSLKLKHAKIELFTSDSLLLKTVFTNDSGEYELPISLDKADTYLVKVSYPKFVHKFFSVSTEGVPKSALAIPFAPIEASLSLFEKVDNVDYSVLNTVLNKYSYNIEKDNYQYDKEYLSNMLARMDTLRSNEEKAKKENLLKLQKQEEQSFILKVSFAGVLLILLLVFFIYKKRKNNARK